MWHSDHPIRWYDSGTLCAYVIGWWLSGVVGRLLTTVASRHQGRRAGRRLGLCDAPATMVWLAFGESTDQHESYERAGYATFVHGIGGLDATDEEAAAAGLPPLDSIDQYAATPLRRPALSHTQQGTLMMIL